MTGELDSGERSFDGELKVDTGESIRILNMNADWQTVEERKEDEDIIQVIEEQLE